MPGYQHLRGLDKQEVRSLLDVVAREGAQRMLIDALEHEVEEFFGRARYERQGGRRPGYRNGVGKPRKIAVGCGTLEIRAPRVRDTDEPFRSQLLPRYQRSSKAVRCRSSTSRAWPPAILSQPSARWGRLHRSAPLQSCGSRNSGWRNTRRSNVAPSSRAMRTAGPMGYI